MEQKIVLNINLSKFTDETYDFIINNKYKLYKIDVFSKSEHNILKKILKEIYKNNNYDEDIYNVEIYIYAHYEYNKLKLLGDKYNNIVFYHNDYFKYSDIICYVSCACVNYDKDKGYELTINTNKSNVKHINNFIKLNTHKLNIQRISLIKYRRCYEEILINILEHFNIINKLSIDIRTLSLISDETQNILKNHNIKKLKISNCKEHNLNFINDIRTIEYLEIYRCKIRNLNNMEKLVNLKSLKIKDNINIINLNNIIKCVSLNDLYIKTELSKTRTLKPLINLKKLTVYGEHHLSINNINSLINLEELHLHCTSYNKQFYISPLELNIKNIKFYYWDTQVDI